MKLFTIGFTQTSAEFFFERLMRSNSRRLIDVRLNNSSQLAGFAKAQDLEYFLRTIGRIEYVHEPLLAPTQEILNAYRKQKGDWSVYEQRFLDLMAQRRIEDRLSPNLFDQACLLCSEAKAHHCHRRLVAEYLNDRWGQFLQVVHL